MSIRTTSLALASALALAVPATVAAAPMPPVAAHVEKTPAPAPVQTSEDAARYADRETRDAGVERFEGGSTFVITMSGTTLALILVLLLIL